jgi:hypothetical protein
MGGVMRNDFSCNLDAVVVLKHTMEAHQLNSFPCPFAQAGLQRDLKHSFFRQIGNAIRISLFTGALARA